MPRRAAAALGYEGDPAKLAAKVTAEADRTVGVVRITATDKDPDEAARIANAFANEVQSYLIEDEAADQEEASAALQAQEDQMRAEIAALDPQIAAAPANVEPRRGARPPRPPARRHRGPAGRRTGDTVEFATVQTAQRGTERDPLPGTRSREQRMLLAGGVALILGFGLAIALDRSDTRIRQRRTAEAHYGAAVLAEIPLFYLPSRRRKLLLADEPDSVRAEGYRTLRTAIMLVREPDHAEGRRAGQRDGPSPAGRSSW